VRKKATALIAAGVLLAVLLAGTLLILSHRTGPKLANVPTVTASAIPEKSIAVLPFENRSEEKQNAYFADGVQDEILTDLAKAADLKVISRTSVMQYKSGAERNVRDIGQQLGVAHVVEGSVQRFGNRVRVNAQLIDARTDAHLWGQSYDRDLADIFAIQSEIAQAIADQLQAKLSPREKSEIARPPTNDIAAFDLYTRANTLLLRYDVKANVLQAADLLNQAVAHDPTFFQAYCLLATTHGNLYFYDLDHTPERLALADAAVEAAFRLRPDAGEAHLARAVTLYHGHLDYDGALAELKVARQTLPNDSRTFFLAGAIELRRGNGEEGLRNLARAVELDPRNINPLKAIAQYLGFRLRRYAEAEAVWDRVLTIEPNDVDAKLTRAGMEFDWKADTRPWHQLLDSIRATNPAELQKIANDWLVVALCERDAAGANDALNALGDEPLRDGPVQLNRQFLEGVVARMTKDEEKARSAFTVARVEQQKLVQAQPNYGPPLCVLGLIDAALGRKDEALREGRRAVELYQTEKTGWDKNVLNKYLAMIAAWAGDKNLACEQLAIAKGSYAYGELKLAPFWDPLRGDPRFEKIVASLAPKAAP
jgi:TolB-like protein/Tfp pilus assembly protein PilF